MDFVKTRRAVLRGLSRLVAVAVLAGGLAPAPLLAAATPPEAFVQELADDVATALRDRGRPQELRLRAVDELVGRGFALDRIARIALGRYWRAATAAEREEFSALFKASVLASYGRRFDDYADRRVRVGAASPAGEQVMVESRVEGGPSPIRLDWRVAQIDGRWQVLDVMVEGVSLTVTYRNEFAAVIDQGGGRVAALIAELRDRAGGRNPRAAG
jgi:phospholipid transport system substrate-binding protein